MCVCDNWQVASLDHLTEPHQKLANKKYQKANWLENQVQWYVRRVPADYDEKELW